MLDTQSIVNDLGDTHLPHHANLQKKINDDSVGKWNKNLTQDQVAMIPSLIGRNLNRLKYTGV